MAKPTSTHVLRDGDRIWNASLHRRTRTHTRDRFQSTRKLHCLHSAGIATRMRADSIADVNVYLFSRVRIVLVIDSIESHPHVRHGNISLSEMNI